MCPYWERSQLKLNPRLPNQRNLYPSLPRSLLLNLQILHADDPDFVVVRQLFPCYLWVYPCGAESEANQYCESPRQLCAL